jgi:hypothetical protein
LGLAVASRLAEAQTSPEVSPPTQLPAVQVQGLHLEAQQRIRDTSTFATVVDITEATTRVDSVQETNLSTLVVPSQKGEI